MAKSRYPNVHRSISKGILDQLHIQLDGGVGCLLRRQFILRGVGNGRAKINSSFPSWRQEDIRNVKGNSSLSLTKYRRRGSLLTPEQSSTTRSFAAESARDHLTDFSRGARTSSGKGYSYMPLKVDFNACYLKLVSQELLHFGVIVRLFRQIWCPGKSRLGQIPK